MDPHDKIWLDILGVFQGVFVVLLVLIGLRLGVGLLQLAHYFLTLPLRRAERARLFLDVLEATLKQGQPLEETLISLGRSRDLSMGLGFHLVSAWLEAGLSLDAALARVPRFLPPQITAMLAAGKQMGDAAKVLPACRQLLKDANSQTRGAMSYLIIMTLVTTPTGFYIFGLLVVFVIPKYLAIAAGMGNPSGVALLAFLAGHFRMIACLQVALLLLLWSVAAIYIGGPCVTAWFPVLDRLHYWLPWRRHRMQRDFSTLLAVLLDAGVPEAAALTLAADGTANSVFRQRAACAVQALRQGMKLPEAIQLLDDAGEFRWRLRNAAAAPGGFFRALAGWHESLDARAFQQEQAAAHGVTTALVLWSGLFVGAIAISVFMFFSSSIITAALW